MRAIARNAGIGDGRFCGSSASAPSGLTFDVVRGTWVDAGPGLLDPLAVLRTALQASASAARTAMTTGVLVRTRQTTPPGRALDRVPARWKLLAARPAALLRRWRRVERLVLAATARGCAARPTVAEAGASSASCSAVDGGGCAVTAFTTTGSCWPARPTVCFDRRRWPDLARGAGRLPRAVDRLLARLRPGRAGARRDRPGRPASVSDRGRRWSSGNPGLLDLTVLGLACSSQIRG